MQNSEIFSKLLSISLYRSFDGVDFKSDRQVLEQICLVAEENGIAFEYDEAHLNLIFTINGSNQDEIVVVGSNLQSISIGLSTLIQICKHLL
jgi:hypothetical protein